MSAPENINIEDLIEKIINNAPSPVKTYNLVFEDFNGVKNIFEFCMEVFTKLSVTRFGNADGKVDISTWTDNTIQTIADYFASFGFRFNIIITKPDDPNMHIYNSMRHDVITITPETHLSSIMYMLKLPSRVYLISFDYII
jgi:hypothetical protein